MTYYIAIPTYKRYHILKQKTLRLLEKHQIPRTKIYIFVADDIEKEIYEAHLPNYPNIIVGRPSLKNQRNFINQYFKKGDQIVQMDDDVRELYQLVINPQEKNKYKRKSMTPVVNLHQQIVSFFQELRRQKLFLWGVYPIDNAYFMSDNVTNDLRIIVGPFWGYINRQLKSLDNILNEKEDIERTIKYFIKDGGVIRFNYISIETSYYQTPGGMQSEGRDRKKEALKSAQYLVAKYPAYCQLNLKKKSGMPDVTLIRRPKV